MTADIGVPTTETLPVPREVVLQSRAKPYNRGKEDNWAAYDAIRPTYPPEMYARILDYHKEHSGDYKLALDCATGTGTVVPWLLEHFESAVGYDTGEAQIDEAKKKFANEPRARFLMHSANEKLESVADGSVSLITAGTAVAWFDIDLWLAECSRLLKPGGTLAFFSYTYPIIANSAEADRLQRDFMAKWWTTIAEAEQDPVRHRRIWRSHSGFPHLHLDESLWTDHRRVLYWRLPSDGYQWLAEKMMDRNFEPSKAKVEIFDPVIKKLHRPTRDFELWLESFGGQWEPFEALPEWTETKRKMAEVTRDSLDMVWGLHIVLATRK